MCLYSECILKLDFELMEFVAQSIRLKICAFYATGPSMANQLCDRWSHRQKCVGCGGTAPARDREKRGRGRT
jgi:hypothetical protein